MGGRRTKEIKVEEVVSSAPVAERKEESSAPKKRHSSGPKKVRGKAYREARGKIDPQAYPLEEAVRKVKEISYSNFDASVDAHINLGLEAGKAEHQLRSFLALPHGTGKAVKVLVFAEGPAAKAAKEAGADQIGDEALLEGVAQGKAPDFGAVIATPAFMPKLAKVARVLGPRGLMPTPKNGTVTENPAEVVAQLKKGRVEIKTEAQPIVHVSIGKVSFPEADLIENLKAVVAELNRIKPAKVSGAYIKSIFLAPTMGPSVKVDLTSL